jgi:hypothetical protein
MNTPNLDEDILIQIFVDKIKSIQPEVERDENIIFIQKLNELMQNQLTLFYEKYKMY